VARLVAKAVDPQRPVEGGTIWIVDDVTERRDVERALAQARDAAEAANRAKSAFLANTSHEIRTPLNGLLGLTRLARQGGIAEAQRQVYLAQIADSAENLAAIISDILDLSKIEAGKLEIESSEFDLHELLQSMHRAYAALSQPRGLTLTLHIDASVPNRVRGDAMRLRQILGNYLTNALKFTEKGGLTLNARAGSDDRLRFEVGDTGPGIDLATQARLFQPFTQADDSITRRFGGTGLGLSICRELAQLMGGEVGLESRLGVGSTFFVELPFPAVAPSPQISPTLEPDSAAALAGTHMLLVEDHPVNMMVAQAMLEQWGVRVEVATDGQAALDAVAQATRRGDDFDAVLMDVQMPGMSGYEATQILRRQYAADALPVIALTAAALVSEREQALSYGMNDFLTKPIDGARLHAALVRCLRRGRR
jgi:signal transduction histidine kinase/CheY-like chemotaxis protein